MRTGRALWVFAAIAALVALTMSAPSDHTVFELLSPILFVIATLLVVLYELPTIDRKPSTPFVPSTALRAPPLHQLH